MSVLKQNEKKILIYFGWYGTCEKSCTNFDLKTDNVRSKLYKVWQLTDDNQSYVRFDATVDKNFDTIPNFQDFTELSCGKSYIIILKPGTESFPVDGFTHTELSSDDLGRISKDINCEYFEEIPEVTPSVTHTNTDNFTEFNCQSTMCITGPAVRNRSTYTDVSDIFGIYTKSTLRSEDFSIDTSSSKNLPVYVKLNEQHPTFDLGTHVILIFTSEQRWRLALATNTQIVSDELSDLHSNILDGDEVCVSSAIFPDGWSIDGGNNNLCINSDSELNISGCSDVFCVSGLREVGVDYNNSYFYAGLDYRKEPYWETSVGGLSECSIKPTLTAPNALTNSNGNLDLLKTSGSGGVWSTKRMPWVDRYFVVFHLDAHTQSHLSRFYMKSVSMYTTKENNSATLTWGKIILEASDDDVNWIKLETWQHPEYTMDWVFSDTNSESENLYRYYRLRMSGFGGSMDHGTSFSVDHLDYELNCVKNRYLRVIKKVDDINYVTDMWAFSENSPSQFPIDVYAWTSKSACPQFATWSTPNSTYRDHIKTLYVSANECYQEKDCTELVFDENNVTEFNATGEDQIYTVPGGITHIKALLWGAGGSDGCHINSGGSGGFTEVVIPVIPGEKLAIGVGQTSIGTSFDSFNIPGYSPGNKTAGYGGSGHLACAGSGGGMSGIYRSNTHISNVIAIAGGGGGAGTHTSDYSGGGAGGGFMGTSGSRFSIKKYSNGELREAYGDLKGGGGGTANSGGQPAIEHPAGFGSSGSLGGGGTGGTRDNSSGGGGGAGYYGGAGGNATVNYDGSGGGGSGYINRRESTAGYMIVGTEGKYDKTTTTPLSPIFNYNGILSETRNLYNELRGDAGNGNTHGKVVIFVSIECES